MQAQRLKRVGFRSAHGSGSQVLVTTWLAEDPYHVREISPMSQAEATEVIVALDLLGLQFCSSLSRTLAKTQSYLNTQWYVYRGRKLGLCSR